MLHLLRAIPCLGVLSLLGCGTVVPSIQEDRSSPIDGVLMVQAIVHSVRCEIVKSLKDIKSNPPVKQGDPNLIAFLDKWGVQMTITLTIDEKSSITPSFAWAPTSFIALGFNADVSADAQRVGKLGYYYLVSTLTKAEYCETGVQMGNDQSLLVQSDLKLEEWIRAYLSTIGTGEGTPPTDASGALKDNVLSQDIKFDVTTSGGINPAWKLRRVSGNQSGNFLSGSRDRTHDVIITLGPGDKTGFIGTAAPIADQTQQISNAVAAGLKNALIP